MVRGVFSLGRVRVVTVKALRLKTGDLAAGIQQRAEQQQKGAAEHLPCPSAQTWLSFHLAWQENAQKSCVAKSRARGAAGNVELDS